MPGETSWSSGGQVVALRHHQSLGVGQWLTKDTMVLVRFSAMWQLALPKWCNNLPLLSQTSSTHTCTYTYAFACSSCLFALPIPTGTHNIVLSYKKRFLPPLPSIAVIIELMQMERDICMLKCWPLSYAQQMFPCHLLKLRRVDTGQRARGIQEGEKVTRQGAIDLQSSKISTTKLSLQPCFKTTPASSFS